MKKALLGLFVAAFGAFATSAKTNQASILGLNFTAPQISGTGNVYNPQVGDIVFDSSSLNFYGYNGSAWASFTPTASTAMPVGSIIAYSGTSDPTGFLICDGRAVSRTTYAALFSAIGTTYGQGDGSTTFNIPDLRGRFLRVTDDPGNGTGAAARDPDASSRTAMNSGGNTGNAIGSVEGQATKKNGLSLNDTGHSHLISDPGHSHTATDSGHSHTLGTASATGSSGPQVNYGYIYSNGNSGGSNLGSSTSYANISVASHSTGITGTNSNTSGITINSGDNETRPVNVNVNYIIKTTTN